VGSAITTRRLFSGAGLYCDGVIFALILRDTLYFKVDDGNRRAYQADQAPATPTGRARSLLVPRRDHPALGV
jgi:TfoX/Sxy family transcriptional regulator of competence genes